MTALLIAVGGAQASARGTVVQQARDLAGEIPEEKSQHRLNSSAERRSMMTGPMLSPAGGGAGRGGGEPAAEHLLKARSRKRRAE